MLTFLEFIGGIAHPRLLGLLLLVNIPVFVIYARTVYRDADELAQNVKQAAMDAVAADEDAAPVERDRYSGSGAFGAILYVLVCASFVKAEYVFISWLLDR